MDDGQPPARRNHSERVISKPRHFSNARNIENMSSVGVAVSAIRAPVIVDQPIVLSRIRTGSVKIGAIADTVRPSVIGVEAHTMTHPFLRREEQRVVACGTAGSELIDVAEVLSFLRVQQGSQPPLVRVVSCVARRQRGSPRTRNDDSGIELLSSPKMSRLIPHVRGRKQPFVTELPLNAQIP